MKTPVVTRHGIVSATEEKHIKTTEGILTRALKGDTQAPQGGLESRWHNFIQRQLRFLTVILVSDLDKSSIQAPEMEIS